jgi:hypothetical protein
MKRRRSSLAVILVIGVAILLTTLHFREPRIPLTTQFVSPWPEVYLPLIVKDAGADARYVAWITTPELLQQAGFKPTNGIHHWGKCANCLRQCAPFGYDCQIIAQWAADFPGRFFVLGDEPDQFGPVSPGDYLAWYNPCYQTIKAADPSATVTIAGIAQDYGQPGTHGLEYLNELWAVGFQTDQLRVHCFPPQDGGSLDGWKACIENWLTWRDAHLPDAPLALGTFGYPSGQDADPLLLSRMEEMMGWLEASSLEEWYWWQWYGQESTYNANRLFDGQGLTPAGQVWYNMAHH